MTEDDTFIFCALVCETPRPCLGSVQRQCGQCDSGVWVSPASIAQIPSLPGDVSFLCRQCAVPIITRKKPELLPPSDATLREVIAELARRGQTPVLLMNRGGAPMG